MKQLGDRRSAIKPHKELTQLLGTVIPLKDVDHNFRTMLTDGVGCVLERFFDSDDILVEIHYWKGDYEDGQPDFVFEHRVRGDLLVRALG